jgi:hypothetical protein
MTDDFDAFDSEVWVPHYLPHWSSRAESAATYAVQDSELRLTIPVGQGLWCPGDHDPPLRVSGVQSGVLDGQSPFRDGQVVREHQENRRTGGAGRRTTGGSRSARGWSSARARWPRCG